MVDAYHPQKIIINSIGINMVGQHQHPAPVTVSKSTLCRQGAVGTRWGAVGPGPAIGQHAERGVEQRCNGLVVEAVRGQQDDPEPRPPPLPLNKYYIKYPTLNTLQ